MCSGVRVFSFPSELENGPEHVRGYVGRQLAPLPLGHDEEALDLLRFGLDGLR